MNEDAVLHQILVWAIPVILAITFHEAAHGFVAHHFGDETAWRLGRVTLNPIKHIDLFGTILLPALLLLATRSQFLFGYAKPVPVNFGRLHNPKRDMIWVAAAGPATNVLLALASGWLLRATPYLSSAAGTWALQNLLNSIKINVALAVFNMIPLPPLDGGRVAVGLLPRALAIPLARTERYGMLILLTLLFVLPYIGEQVHRDFDVIRYLLEWPYTWLVNLIATLTGLSR
jgi:Zn-dependent protease